jgi:hypothetical protein
MAGGGWIQKGAKGRKVRNQEPQFHALEAAG